jgi:2-succinyl-6-hydroxy-2,4-cyclohexadiene-1-carboxylate synthase
MALAWQSFGSPNNPSVLLLHGFLGSSEDWQPVIEQLQTGYHVIAVDLPGHGKSLGLPPVSYTFPGMVNELFQLLRTEKIHKISIVGYSMGGRIAMYLIHRAPEIWNHAIIIAASPGLSGEERRSARADWQEKQIELIKSQPIDEFVQLWYKMDLFDPLRNSPVFSSVLQRRLHNNGPELAKAFTGFSILNQPDFLGPRHEIRCPILYISGSADEKYCRIGEEFGHFITGSRAVVIGGAGHSVHLEKPEETTRIIQNYLKTKPC